MSFKRYTIALLAGLLLLFASNALFNRIVDPYWFFQDLEIKGFNLDKPRFPRNERLVKPALLLRFAPEAVIVGNSYAEVGLPPTHSGFTNKGRLKPYNFAMSGAPWSEVYCMTMFALEKAPLKAMVLGAAGTVEAVCPSHSDYGKPDYAKLLLSKNAYDASWETLHKQDAKPRITREGQWYFKRYEEKIQSDDDVAMNFANELREHFCATTELNDQAVDYRAIHSAPALSEEEGRGLRNIIRLAIRKNVRLVLLNYPKHVFFYELSRQCGRLPAQWARLWQIVSLVEAEAGANSDLIQVWDFNGYREANGERVRAGKKMSDRLWQDTGHFNHEVGAIMFDSIFSGGTTFGSRVTRQNFDDRIAASERERLAFVAANPWLLSELNELARLAGFGRK